MRKRYIIITDDGYILDHCKAKTSKSARDIYARRLGFKSDAHRKKVMEYPLEITVRVIDCPITLHLLKVDTTIQ